jgi:hypothetical protein
MRAHLLPGAIAVMLLADMTATGASPDVMTSAGVFDHKGRLLKTLWSGQRQGGSQTTVEWNGCDDEGRPTTNAGPLRLGVLSHRITANWGGVIGNTSRPGPGQMPHRAYSLIHDMAIDAKGRGFYAVGYNEQQHGLHQFSTAAPQGQVLLGRDDYRRAFRHVATDGRRVYAANVGVMAAPGAFNRDATTFVVAYDSNDGKQVPFPRGQDVNHPQPGNRWHGVIDLDTTDTGGMPERFPSAALAIAVQRTGKTLFVAHTDEIRLFDKTTGERVGTIRAQRPIDLATAADDSLWVLGGTTGAWQLQQWRDGPQGWQRVGVWSTPASRPVALGLSPTDGTLVIADAGTHQLLVHDTAGRLLRRLGQAHAYRDGDPTVASDRFWLDAGPTYVAFQPDGSFWLGDPGNQRNLRLTTEGRYLDTLQYLPATYRTSLDPQVPGTVYAGFLEFALEPATSAAPGWRLVRNWNAGMAERYRHAFAGVLQLRTDDAGRQTAVFAAADGRRHLFAMDKRRGALPTGVELPADSDWAADGSLRELRVQGNTLAVLGRPAQQDREGRWAWGPPRVLAELRQGPNDPVMRNWPHVRGVNDLRLPETDDGLIVLYDVGKSPGFHLGALRTGHGTWWWRALPSGEWTLDGTGRPIAELGRYETGRGVHYPGSIVAVEGAHIIAGYHGEGWNGGQANQWFHYHASGLFVGQFGVPVYPSTNQNKAQPGAAGNAFSFAMVRAGDALTLWHNDESVHGGLHHWQISGLDSLRLDYQPLPPRMCRPGG